VIFIPNITVSSTSLSSIGEQQSFDFIKLVELLTMDQLVKNVKACLDDVPLNQIHW